MESAPTEILIKIFNLLSPKQITKCRQVCWRWKRIIDDILDDEGLWQKYCQKDFNSIYSKAHYQCMPGVNWSHIYRSLMLWSKLGQAQERRDDIPATSRPLDEIRDFKVLRHGIIGVHTQCAINYYDVDTLRPSGRPAISGSYTQYFENDDFIIILGLNLNLFVMRKTLVDQTYETNNTFENVKAFHLANQDLMFITSNDEVCLCKLENVKIRAVQLCRANSSIMSIGYDNKHINILTFQRDVFTLVGRELIYQKTLDSSTNLLHELKKYQFLENLDWRVYFQWMYLLKHTVPQGPLRDIIFIKTYGEAVFVGSNWGIFRIYYAPYHNNEFDIHNSQPVKQYNFMERCETAGLSMCPILQIDVIEGIDRHIVLVAMPKKIAVLSYKHGFQPSTSDETPPNNELENIPTNGSE